MASGVIRRLFLSGFEVIALEQDKPTCVRRLVSFAEAVFDSAMTVEGVTARLVGSVDEALSVPPDVAPILIDPKGETIPQLHPQALIDARMLKAGVDYSIDEGPIVIGLGPGFEAGRNCHAVVETNRGPDLGRVTYQGAPEPDTGVPAAVDGISADRVLRAPAAGVFASKRNIGDMIKPGDLIAEVSGEKLHSRIGGVLRGLIRDGVTVTKGLKVGDIDPRGKVEYCYRVSDKAGAIAGGVLEALLVMAKGKS